MRALILVHNLPERGSWFRGLEIGRRLARAGHHVQFAYTSDKRRFRPVYRRVAAGALVPAGEPGCAPSEANQILSVQHARIAPPQAADESSFVWSENPRFTLFNDIQEGWSLFDNAVRVRDALASRWDLVYGLSHKPDCVLPALAARQRGAKVVLDWADWWGGSEGLFKLCVLRSNGHLSLPRVWRCVRRAVFEAESWWEPRVYGLADAVTLISEEYYHHPCAPRDLRDKSLVLHSGSPLEAIRPLPVEDARRALGLEFPEGATVFGYVANFHLDERLLLEAFARLCDVRPDVYLLVAGADFDQSDPDLHRRTRGRIFHAGRQPFTRIGHFLGAADLLVLPLSDLAIDRARYPHKLSDYVAAGRPIVSCDVGETGRLLRRYGFGSLTPPTAAGLAGGLLEMLDRRPEWPELGRQTREAAERHFDWDVLCERLFAFLRDRLNLEV